MQKILKMHKKVDESLVSSPLSKTKGVGQRRGSDEGRVVKQARRKFLCVNIWNEALSRTNDHDRRHPKQASLKLDELPEESNIWSYYWSPQFQIIVGSFKSHVVGSH